MRCDEEVAGRDTAAPLSLLVSLDAERKHSLGLFSWSFQYAEL